MEKERVWTTHEETRGSDVSNELSSITYPIQEAREIGITTECARMSHPLDQFSCTDYSPANTLAVPKMATLVLIPRPELSEKRVI